MRGIALALGMAVSAWAGAQRPAATDVSLASAAAAPLTTSHAAAAGAPRPAAVPALRDMPLFAQQAKEPARARPRARPDFSHVGLPCEPRPRMCASVIE